MFTFATVSTKFVAPAIQPASSLSTTLSPKLNEPDDDILDTSLATIDSHVVVDRKGRYIFVPVDELGILKHDGVSVTPWLSIKGHSTWLALAADALETTFL